MAIGRSLERSLLGLFVASGFAGLIYQAIWSHYLGLSLGHAAYAQSLVLGIFMGGMALGAWLVSHFGTGWRRLILAYAVVEVAIGLAGLLFHPFFLSYTGFSQDTVYPALESAGAVRAWQWGSAALLIAPQSILLGMTFPLMSGGYLRVAPREDGEILGGLYFSNSIGAAGGALVATFVLLPWVGMPGAMLLAGGVNIMVGLVAWRLSLHADAQPPKASPQPSLAATATSIDRGFYRMVLLGAGITGASSFVYEIGWVRLLNQALGTTVHSFELMLSAFILGLAFGGLWIRKRSANLVDAVAYAGYAQIFMGIAALISIPVFSQSFRWVGAMMSALPKTDEGYVLFSLGSGVIALLVMFPAAFFAGMTLPLFTMALLRRGWGESSIGRVYAANTLGAIVGVVLAVHVLIPMLGLRLAVTLAAVADIALGIVLLRLYSDHVTRRGYTLASLAAVVVLVGSLLGGKLDPRALASGVFRNGESRLGESTEVHFLRDGKTATVAVISEGSTASIATNGKSDASLEMDATAVAPQDEITMLMAAALPLAIHPAPRDVAIIGWGSGLTTHTMLGSSVPERVETIEIERAMYDGAKLFGERVARAYDDPRSGIRIDDARTYFSTGQKRFDVIVSEPSNPWVSGVSSLFTKQFYHFLGRHLNEGGIVIQWLQSYELNDALLATMLAALNEEFPHIDVYLTNSADLLFVSSHQPLPALDANNIGSPELVAELRRVGLASNADYASRRLGSQRMLQTLVRLTGAEPHSDFYPVVALQAPRARFVGEEADQMHLLLHLGMPLLEMTDGRQPIAASETVLRAEGSSWPTLHLVGVGVHAALAGGDDSKLANVAPELLAAVGRLRNSSAGPVEDVPAWLTDAGDIAEQSMARVAAADQAGLWAGPVWINLAEQPVPVQRVLAAYDASARRDAGAMAKSGVAALEALDESAPLRVREHMLLIALLGAAQTGGQPAVLEIEKNWGRAVPPQGDYGFARAFLLAWVDQPKP